MVAVTALSCDHTAQWRWELCSKIKGWIISFKRCVCCSGCNWVFLQYLSTSVNNHCVFVNTELCRRLLTIDSHSPSSSSQLLLWWWDDPQLNFSNIQQQLRREPWSMSSSRKQEKEKKQWLQVSVKLQKAWCSRFIRDDGCVVGPARLEQADKSAPRPAGWNPNVLLFYCSGSFLDEPSPTSKHPPPIILMSTSVQLQQSKVKGQVS